MTRQKGIDQMPSATPRGSPPSARATAARGDVPWPRVSPRLGGGERGRAAPRERIRRRVAPRHEGPSHPVAGL